MPKNCGECKFFAWKRVVGNHCAIDESITFHATLDGLDVRYERNGNCPLDEIPPHGRLVDADALLGNVKTVDYIYRKVLRWLIDHASTIIEAEVDE